jgi:hypothetical protein
LNFQAVEKFTIDGRLDRERSSETTPISGERLKA